MRKYIFTISVILVSGTAFACDACKKQKSLFTGISHGRGPESNWDYLIVALMIVVTLYVLFAALKCMFKSSENHRSHIKYTFIESDDYGI
ncbi:hypothetical protein D0C36_19660 [Mucilaginibacter conchicola]|uniref:Uncharacterized protein n=2 Tax=Mucilaginibacter conchicola TaxID=2303333 RepID=A0A372NQF0_9SPHI|nr:hypothetical protein D0C36_19660 [Mucilaginibacter conchicola]